MFMLKVIELVLVIFYVAFMITEIFIPLAKSLPLFPSFRKDETKIKK